MQNIFFLVITAVKLDLKQCPLCCFMFYFAICWEILNIFKLQNPIEKCNLVHRGKNNSTFVLFSWCRQREAISPDWLLLLLNITWASAFQTLPVPWGLWLEKRGGWHLDTNVFARWALQLYKHTPHLIVAPFNIIQSLEEEKIGR